MQGSYPVVDGLRRTLAKPRSSASFIRELEDRVRQLIVGMVDGRVLPKPEAEALCAAVVELVKTEALPKLASAKPADALRVIDMLAAYGFARLDQERAELEEALPVKWPPPAPPRWPELAELREAAASHPDACTVTAAVRSVGFAKDLQDDGIWLPDELLALYAACDGFDLSCVAAPKVPVFSLLPSKSIDTSDAEPGYPRRAAVFQGGDEVQLSVYREAKKAWWLVYEYEYQPIGKKPLDLPELLRFGLARMRAADSDALHGALAWDEFFGIADG